MPVSINVVSAPVANSQSVSVPYESAGKTITLSASGGIPPYTYTYAQTGNGTVTGTAPNVTYKPNAAFTGADPFTFFVVDSNGKQSNTATVSITVNPATPCVAQAVNLTIPYGTIEPVALNATGATPYTFIYTQPTSGSVSGTYPNITYAPNTGFSGSDNFTYTCTNPGNAAGPSAAVNITVLAPGNPIAQNLSTTVPYGAPATTSLNATGGVPPYNYTVVTAPTSGTLSATQGPLSSLPAYTPKANVTCGTQLGQCAADSFTYFVTDSLGHTSNTATATISVQYPVMTLTGAAGVPPSLQTVAAGQTATYKLQISGWAGATGPVNFTCTGAPVPCTATPNPVTLNGTTVIPFTVTVTPTTKAAGGFVSAPGTAGGWPWMLALSLAGLMGILLSARNRKLQWRFAGACAALVLAVGLSSCGSGKVQAWSTQTGQYQITVTATAGSSTASIPLNLNVQ